MNLNELADLHNRRGNIGVVARRCAEHSYPLLAWPEDKALLRLADLPHFKTVAHFNTPASWTSCEYFTLWSLTFDQDLQNILKPGRAYGIIDGLRQGLGFAVAEYKVVTR